MIVLVLQTTLSNLIVHEEKEKKVQEEKNITYRKFQDDHRTFDITQES